MTHAYDHRSSAARQQIEVKEGRLADLEKIESAIKELMRWERRGVAKPAESG